MRWSAEKLASVAEYKLKTVAGTIERSVRRGRLALALPTRPRIWYVVDGADWSNEWDGRYITDYVRRCGLPASVAYDPKRAEGDIVHFGATWSFLGQSAGTNHDRNALVATVFHGDRSGREPTLAKAMDEVLASIGKLKYLVISCHLMFDRFRRWGVDEKKLRMIPLGVDLELFKPASSERKHSLRQRFNVPSDAICIGSFQKDGNGWGSGDEPKMIKGPDVFVETVARLKREFPNLFVLLTGPARGYVKRQLDRLGIPFQHQFVKAYSDVASYYQVLDLYLVTSREEGGPKAVLESLACDIPLVSTRVGMAPDVINDGVNGFLAEIDNVETLTERAKLVLSDHALRDRLVQSGRQTARSYTWDMVGQRYIDEIYRPLSQQFAR